MNSIMGVINLVNEWDHLEELTSARCPASVPFGGRYRLIDFVLSNMVNSGIDDVAVFSHNKYRSLMDHLGSGKEWDLDRKRGGLFVLPFIHDDAFSIPRGDLYQFYNHRDYFYRGPQEYVLVTRSHIICNIDYRDVLRQHLERGADITAVYTTMEQTDAAKYRKLEIDDNGRVTVIESEEGRLNSPCISMEMYLMKKSLLLDLVDTCLSQGYYHLVRDGIMKNVNRLHISGYRFDGYTAIINSIQSYYRHSMNLLQPSVLRELFFQPNSLIYTKVKDEPPARYMNEAIVKNSLIANGCTIEGRVENCIIFRGVKIHKGSVIRNSILLQNGEIQENVMVENAILDKDVFIDRGRVLSGALTAPFIASKKKII
ncbi:glucose-1-phosphate adenylyltransferase subunit GlgD [Paenibacillus turpanensis]|uniref:glucose-1-phosphate adenylyltransferase subunit GlgD n=1 Tax=Paenibacillus turpanensis TaxID=2689078 RepID=UPI00140D00F0|nr:glucose-1-phosphate adenylyltransferase subunit GlgD [Paenibacillus turpanensis]